MKIVIAPDSFKGSLTAREAAQSIESGILKVLAFSVTAELRSSKWPRQAASNTSTRPRAIR